MSIARPNWLSWTLFSNASALQRPNSSCSTAAGAWARRSCCAIGRNVVRELVEVKTPKVLKALPDQGDGWTVYYGFFARAGFTDAARQVADGHGALLVDLKDLDRGLSFPSA